MKIALRTPTAVVLQEPGTFGYAVGALLTLAGVTIVATLALGGSGGVGGVAFVIGAGLAAIGVWAVRRTATTTYAFDRDQRALVIVRRRLAGATTTERYPLAAVDDVIVDESRASSSRASATPTYRVAIRFTDGRTMPCTFYYSGGREPKAEMVNAVREVLSRADGRERAPVNTPEIAAVSTPPSPAQLRSARTAVRGMTVICSLFLVIGAWTGWDEYVRLERWIPTPATVLSARIEMRRSNHRGTAPTFAPIVTYRYTVAGHAYTSDRVTPLSESRGEEWASGIISRFAPGSAATAWYDPGHPDRAYLVHEWSALPVFFILFPLAALLFVRWASRRGLVGARRRP